jgi:hypothetical protein
LSVGLLFAVLMSMPAGTPGAELQTPAVVLRFDPAAGYALSVVMHRAHGLNFLAPSPADAQTERGLWTLYVRDEFGAVRELTPADAESAGHSREDGALVLVWKDVAHEELEGSLDVTVRIAPSPDGEATHWDLAVAGQLAGALWQVDFPCIYGVRPLPEAQMALPYVIGMLVQNPAGHLVPEDDLQHVGQGGVPAGVGVRGQRSLVYPGRLSMQYWAYWGTPEPREPELAEAEGWVPESGWMIDRSDASGLYVAVEDGQLYRKQFTWDTGVESGLLAWRAEHYPPLPEWPLGRREALRPVDYRIPYRTVVAAFTGDYHEAAERYHDWARRQVWMQRGPIDTWPHGRPRPGSDELVRWVPPWFREIGFWAKFYFEPAKVLPEWAAYRNWLRVPIASHYYRSPLSPFDRRYPEFLPATPYLLEGVRAARQMDVRPLPYTNATIWDMQSQSWLREGGHASAYKDSAGRTYDWNLRDSIHARMCPSTDQWQAKMPEVGRKLIGAYGFDGMYMDTLPASFAQLCYDPAHDHSPHGGNYVGRGNRELMERLRADARRYRPEAAFFGECFNEYLIDVMDGFLTLDLSRTRYYGGEQPWPLMATVYGPYTFNFGSDARLRGMKPEHFALLYGRQVVWGTQPLHSDLIPELPAAGHVNSEIFREYTQAYYTAGKRFLAGGRWRRIAVRPPDGRPAATGLELVAPGHVFRYRSMFGGRNQRIWSGPAILASAWERGGDLGIVLANITGAEQSAVLRWDAGRTGLDPQARLLRLWPADPEELGPAGGQHELTLPPWGVVILAGSEDVAATLRHIVPLLETNFELAAVEQGEFPAVEGAGSALWACSDAVMENVRQGAIGHGDCPDFRDMPAERSDGSSAEVAKMGLSPSPGITMQGTFHRYRPDGKLVPCVGHQAEVRGPRAEGHGLPREADRQPFLLARRLPHRLTEGRTTRVLAGDARYLLAEVEAGARLEFAQPGLVVATDVSTGEVVRDLDEPVTAGFALPARDGGRFLVGYAAPLAPGDHPAGYYGDAELWACVRPLAEAWARLPAAAPAERSRRLAAVSRQFTALAEGLDDIPELLEPGGSLRELHSQIQTLVRARLGATLHAFGGHRWLIPGRTKPLQFTLLGHAAPTADRPPLRLRAIGSWRDGLWETTDPHEAEPGQFAAAVRLDDGSYVERIVPVMAVQLLERDGQRFELTEFVPLEANRPVELYAPLEPLDLVAGGTGSFTVTLRNWSPEDLTVALAGEGPAGWRVEPIVAVLKAPALADTEAEFRVIAAEDASTADYRFSFTAHYAEAADTELLAELSANVLGRFIPLNHETPDAPAEDGETARVRGRQIYAAYVRAGEAFEAELTSVPIRSDWITTMRYRLVGPTGKELADGEIPLGETYRLHVPAELAGAHYLTVHAGEQDRATARVVVTTSGNAELATETSPLTLFQSSITRYFYVPVDAAAFRVGLRTHVRPAGLTVTSPEGRRAVSGEYPSQGEIEIAVRPEEAGRVWQLRIEPGYQASLWLAGDAFPYLSVSPKQILAPVAQ